MPPTLHFLLSNSPVLVLIHVPQEIARFLPTLFGDSASFIPRIAQRDTYSAEGPFPARSTFAFFLGVDQKDLG
jgi:hypothetical protein